MLLGLGFCLAFAESGLGLGMIVPGETAVVILAATMHTTASSVLLLVFVAFGACAGDHVGFFIGRHYGDRLRATRVVQRLGQSHYDRAMEVLRRRGAAAIFLTRLVPVIRTLAPAAGGASGLSYRRFAPASLAGSFVWAGVYVGGGSAVAQILDRTGSALGHAAWLVLVAAALVVTPVLIVRRFQGLRPGIAAPDTMSFEHTAFDGSAPRHRRAAFSPLIGDFQI